MATSRPFLSMAAFRKPFSRTIPRLPLPGCSEMRRASELVGLQNYSRISYLKASSAGQHLGTTKATLRAWLDIPAATSWRRAALRQF
jgi:hypothetical protein